MDIYPAIDLRHGRVVRLSQGEATRLTSYGDDPVAVAESFAAAGARWIHLVDLDRAFDEGDNAVVVSAIAERVGHAVQLQLGGGFRSLAHIQSALDLPIARIVIGTAAVTDPDLVPQAVAAAGAARIAVGIDVRDGNVAIRGWREGSAATPLDVAYRVARDGVGTIIYTDITRDGMMLGPDVSGAQALAGAGVDVIASGGVGSLDDLASIRSAGLSGAIVGRALYEGRFTLADAIGCGSAG